MLAPFAKNSLSIKGVAALPVILLISAIIIELVVASAFLAFSFSTGSYGTQLAAEALFGARAGADDATYRVIKNDVDPVLTEYTFSVTIGPRTVTSDITIEKDPGGGCSVAWGCRFRIRSKGRSFIRERKVELILSVDPVSREIKKESFKEIEI